VDRLLSNQGIEVEELLALWVPYMIGARLKIAVAMDWTDFDLDGQATLMLDPPLAPATRTPAWLLTRGNIQTPGSGVLRARRGRTASK